MAAGIEHPQSEWISAHFQGTAGAPDPSLYDPNGKTPNQQALACAIGLAIIGQPGAPPAAELADNARKLFAAMAANGHQAVSGGGYGCEQGAPAPHDELWMLAMLTLLLTAAKQGQSDILASCIQYFADHLAMCRAFWTPGGVRVAGSRAKKVPGQALCPAWPIDSIFRAKVDALAPSDVALLDKSASIAVKMMDAARVHFPAILAVVRPAAVKLFVPVRRWDLAGGGFVAALAEDVPMNDRLSYLIVDASGKILAADNTLGSLPAQRRPADLVFGGAVPVAQPPAPDPSPGVPASTFATRLLALQLSHEDAILRASIIGQLTNASGPALAALADRVAALGIGPGQPQKAAQNQIVADMRAAAGVPSP